MEIFDKNFIKSVQAKFGIIGNSSIINNAIQKLIQAAPTDLNILITGETGTGKEVFANAVHGLSLRKKFPFVSVNCGAIPETLLESELFGHEKGAFTGATDLRIGFFESANKGTIFLDEIGDMPIGTQVKLLRILESGEYTRLGSSELRRVDVRVIAATNRELEKRVKEGKFRQDLFFRLNSVHILLPSLRERTQDIPELIEFFGRRVCAKLNVEFKGISLDAMNVLKSLPWPGNIRELKNLIETIITLEKGINITPEILIKYIPLALPAYEAEIMPLENSLVTLPKIQDTSDEKVLVFRSLLELKNDMSELKMALREIFIRLDKIEDLTENLNVNHYEEVKEVNHFDIDLENMKIEEVESKMIRLALNKFKGNRRLAAMQLGISERTLYRKIQEYNID